MFDFLRDGRAILFRTVPVALTGAAQLQADGISSCCYIVKLYTTIRHELRHARKAWPGPLVDPCMHILSVRDTVGMGNWVMGIEVQCTQ
jgi:hypothetical protein